ncbi:hypothetical protein BY996DRAFT_4604285 [Phakopsora pachyrhizi]|nr:hypothetical protein BY996DRAFT_4604285 [Phakopsora pachyrhizi]
MDDFNTHQLSSFSATALHNNPPEAFASALTFTTSEFQNTPHCDSDSSYVACGWWMQVDKETGKLNTNGKKNVMGGEFYFPQQYIKIDFSKVNGICQIFWKSSKYFHCTLPSKDTTSDTRLGMSCQVSNKLVNAFKK